MPHRLFRRGAAARWVCLWLWFVLARTSSGTDARHAYLTVVYESTDVSHVASLLEYPGESPRWIGFGPRTKYKLAAAGEVDSNSMEGQLARYVRLRVDPASLRRAEATVRRKYRNATYLLGVRDCVTFVIDLAHAAGLDVPPRAHWRVGSLLDALGDRNRGRVDAFDALPYPWHRSNKAPPSAGDLVTVRVEYIDCRETSSIGVRDRIYLVAVDETGKRRKIDVGKLGDGERWRGAAVLFHVPRGSSVGLQLWEADRFSRDDLVFQASFRADRAGRFFQQQARGRAFTGSTSIYRIGLSVQPRE